MAKHCFVCVVGGTGARIGDALIKTLLAGVDDFTADDEMHLLSIDADQGCNDSNSLKMLCENYDHIHHVVQGSGKIANFPLHFYDWQPALDNVSNLSRMAGNNADCTQLMNALYTQQQQTVEVTSIQDGGFRANPNVGVCYLRTCLRAVTDDVTCGYTRFKKALQNAANIGGNDVRLIMVGSLFGGTGAASFVCISSDLCTAANNNPNFLCGALMMTPYFAVRKENAEDADIMKGFYASTQEALTYYDTHRAALPFKTFYLFGSPVLRAQNWTATNQRNLPSWIEAEAAQACLRFFLDAQINQQDHSFYKKKRTELTNPQAIDGTQRNCPSAIQLTALDFGRDTQSANALLKMARFCLNWCYVMEPMILEYGNSSSKGIPNYYTHVIKPIFTDYMQLQDILWSSCRNYLQWMSEMCADITVHQDMLDAEKLKILVDSLPLSRIDCKNTLDYKQAKELYAMKSNQYMDTIKLQAVAFVKANSILNQLPTLIDGKDTAETHFAKLLEALYEVK